MLIDRNIVPVNVLVHKLKLLAFVLADVLRIHRESEQPLEVVQLLLFFNLFLFFLLKVHVAKGPLLVALLLFCLCFILLLFNRISQFVGVY